MIRIASCKCRFLTRNPWKPIFSRNHPIYNLLYSINCNFFSRVSKKGVKRQNINSSKKCRKKGSVSKKGGVQKRATTGVHKLEWKGRSRVCTYETFSHANFRIFHGKCFNLMCANLRPTVSLKCVLNWTKCYSLMCNPL